LLGTAFPIAEKNRKRLLIWGRENRRKLRRLEKRKSLWSLVGELEQKKKDPEKSSEKRRKK